jgi:hypothetical protein
MQEGFAWLDVTKLPGCRLYPRVLEEALGSSDNNGVITSATSTDSFNVDTRVSGFA